MLFIWTLRRQVNWEPILIYKKQPGQEAAQAVKNGPLTTVNAISQGPCSDIKNEKFLKQLVPSLDPF